MTAEEFHRVFSAESTYVERKAGVGRALQRPVVSFSNTEGGVILLGVDDAGSLAGRDLTPSLETEIHEVIAQVHNPGRYRLSRLLVDNRTLTILSISRRREGFAQISDGTVLVRRGSRNQALIGDELHTFVNARSMGRYERTAVEGSLRNTSPDRVGEIAEAFSWDDHSSIEARLHDSGMMEGGHLTVAGALLLMEEPTEVLSKAYVEALRFPDASGDPDQRVEFRGPVQNQIVRATEFIAQSLGTESVVVGVRRHELARLPVEVIREAVANAVAHRSYELQGTAIRIEMRPGAVTIESPGQLPEPVTVENMRDTQAARNPLLISALRRLRLAEDIGRGIDVIQDSMQAYLLEPPAFAETGHSFRVELPVRSPVGAAERAWIRELEADAVLEPADRIILLHAARGEQLTNQRVRQLLNTDDSRTARQALHRLRDEGFLIQHGHRGGASYSLGTLTPPPSASRLTWSELKDQVLEMASEGSIQNAAVREATGLDRNSALRLLSELVDEGRLERRGERRGSRYVTPGALDLG